MNKLNYFICALVLTISIWSCKKETTNTNNGTNPLGNNAPTIPTGAAGALYAVNSNATTQGVTQTTGTAFAWFNSYTTTAQAGAVLCNGDTLSTQIPFSNVAYPWYESTAALLNGNMLDFSATPVAWSVSGSGSVAAFNFTDNAVFPVVNNYTVPATVSLSQPLTLTFTIAGPYDEVICTIQGSKKTVNINYTTASSVTFTAAQIASAAVSGDNLVVQILPVKITAQTIAGKQYYFVKENGFAQYATVQ